jgi:dUTP pyrophosphatase
MTPVLITRLDPELPLPAYEHPGDAGLDLRARIDAEIAPGARFLMPTGIAIALEPGFAAFVHARSGLALKKGLGVANGTGVVDAGYRGEIGVALVNLDPHASVTIARGDRIAQLVIAPIAVARIIEVDELPGSQRAGGGFGSTGGHAGTVST